MWNGNYGPARQKPCCGLKIFQRANVQQDVAIIYYHFNSWQRFHHAGCTPISFQYQQVRAAVRPESDGVSTLPRKGRYRHRVMCQRRRAALPLPLL